MAEPPTAKSSEEPKEPSSDPKPAEEAKESAKSEEKPADEKDEAAAPAKEPVAEAVAPPSTKKPEKEEGERLLVKGNPPRWKRGGITAFGGGFLAFLLMAHNGQLRIGVPLGFLFMLVATWGVLDCAGSFDDAVEPAGKIDSQKLVRALVGVLGAALLMGAALMGGQSGTMHQWMWGALVTVTFELLVYAVFNLGVRIGPWAKDEAGLERPIWKRHGFWLVTVAALLYLPTLGSYGLWDPWETHYGEVARNPRPR